MDNQFPLFRHFTNCTSTQASLLYPRETVDYRTLSTIPSKTQQVKKQASSFVPLELIRCNFDESRSHSTYHHQIPDTIRRRHIPPITHPRPHHHHHCTVHSVREPTLTGRGGFLLFRFWRGRLKLSFFSLSQVNFLFSFSFGFHWAGFTHIEYRM